MDQDKQTSSENDDDDHSEDEEESDGSSEEEETIQQKLAKVEIECPPTKNVKGIDFSFYTRKMLEETKDLPKGISMPIFNKKPLL